MDIFYSRNILQKLNLTWLSTTHSKIIEIISPLLDRTASAYQFSKFLEEGFDLAINNTLQGIKILDDSYPIIEIISPLIHGTASAYQFSKFLEEGFDLASQQHTPRNCPSHKSSQLFIYAMDITQWRNSEVRQALEAEVRSENLNPTCSSQAETVNNNADKVRSENLNPTCSSQAETVNTNADKVHSENLNPICLSQAETANTNADKVSLMD
ncbi:hypothetical protein DAPPUDRAFT_263168 [Daphnia pulex]|uniref:Uncharacterized protein n=1 Tax=Daphnia pulex TaxID=6669 RepID=E9HP86_DAPPU|nr:hypothetical protein DAPPUDRAFT_263168 [Daphnia pulex]|eukprot:EFX66393.1 hypothetical protein DAPPUDRAFT_263168 [Daphnia pulex]